MSGIVHSLVAASELWLEPQNPLREETIQALQVSTGQNRHQIEMALHNCFSEITTPKTTAVAEIGACPQGVSRCVLHVLPSNVFTAWVHGAVITLLMGHTCLLKPSRREPVFAQAWKKSLALIDPVLAAKVEIVSWKDVASDKTDVVVAYGSDETLGDIHSKLPAGIPFAGFGHKLSVGIIFQEAIQASFEDLCEKIVCDAEPFRLQGCLSPQVLYVEGNDHGLERALQPRLSAIPKMRTFSSFETLYQDLEKFKPYLSSVGYAGGPEKGSWLEKELRELQISRVCPLGEMQRPPLDWRNGDIFLPDLLH